MLKIVYENIPTGSMQGSSTDINYKQPFLNMADFKIERKVHKYATLEHNFWILNGTFPNFPDVPTNLGYMSTIMSDENGNFENEIVITRDYDANYTAPGLMIEFDSNTNNYAKNMNVKWYRDNELLSEKDYVVDNAIYFCNNQVIAFNKVVVTITSINNAYRFLKIFNISDGIIRTFFQDELENVDILEEISTKNETLSINNTSVNIINKNDIGILFQRTLPFKVYRDDTLYGCFFIDTSSSNTKKTFYTISANDYIGLLEYQMHLGGMYFNITVSDLITDILGDIPYELDESIKNKTITGYLPIQTKREALRQVVFSIGGMVDSSRSEKLIIKPLSNEIDSYLGNDRIVNVKTTELAITTVIELNTHKYKINSEETELFNDTLSGTTYLTFSSPMHDLKITGGTILNSGTNYATIQANGSVILTGQGYDDVVETIKKTNSATSTTDLEKVETHETTLNCNSNELLDSLKFVKSNVDITFRMITEKVGDLIDINGTVCRIKSLSFSAEQKNIYASSKMEVYDG
ncbi:MAG: hypothetical protein IJX99_02190 [Clostridia bacterium]|nr:hypothetical protein [Clostridia bacterium]